MTRILIALGVLGTMLWSACQPVEQTHPGQHEIGKRIAALENSLAALKEDRSKTKQHLRKMATRQDLLKKGLQRLARRQQSERVVSTDLRHDLEYDAGKSEEVATVVNKVIEAMAHMQQAIASLRTKIMRLRETQSQIEQQMPAIIFPIKGKEKKPTNAIPKMPVDEKKRKKVMGSVAFLPAEESQQDRERRHA